MTAPLAVVHLVRRGNDPSALQGFLESYRAHEAGTAHELVFILKGFDDGPGLAAVLAALQAFPHRELRADDSGFDLGPYFAAARAFEFERFAFLNSFARIRCDGWLGKIEAQLLRPGVGIAGATGSWESLRKDVAERYRGRPWPRRLAAHVREALKRQRFPPFPNPHVRSNAFMATRETLLKVRVPPLNDKDDAHGFESGLQGITRQVQALGLRPVVVGCDGRAYEIGEWHASGTFRQGQQENLLVEDNQTLAYQRGTPEQRRAMARSAWRDRAMPA